MDINFIQITLDVGMLPVMWEKKVLWPITGPKSNDARENNLLIYQWIHYGQVHSILQVHGSTEQKEGEVCIHWSQSWFRHTK